MPDAASRRRLTRRFRRFGERYYPSLATLTLAIIGGVVVGVTVMVLVSRMARKAVLEAVAQTENPEPPGDTE